MSEYNNWLGILGGVFAIIYGVYSLVRPGSVASWLAGRQVPHSLQQIKIVGVLSILAGIFFVVVVIRNH